MYFNYHAKVQKLIKEKHAICFEYLASYHNICPCMLIYFDDGRKFPIRSHRFEEYEFLLAKYSVEKIDDNKKRTD